MRDNVRQRARQRERDGDRQERAKREQDKKKSKAKVHEKQWARERRGGKRYNFFPCWQPKAKHGGERERARRGGPPSRI